MLWEAVTDSCKELVEDWTKIKMETARLRELKKRYEDEAKSWEALVTTETAIEGGIIEVGTIFKSADGDRLENILGLVERHLMTNLASDIQEPVKIIIRGVEDERTKG